MHPVTTTITQSITGSGGMQKLGPGTLIITSNNPGYSGTTILTGGSLFADAVPAGPGDLPFGTGLLEIHGSGVTLGSHVSGEFIFNPTLIEVDFFVAPTT